MPQEKHNEYDIMQEIQNIQGNHKKLIKQWISNTTRMIRNGEITNTEEEEPKDTPLIMACIKTKKEFPPITEGTSICKICGKYFQSQDQRNNHIINKHKEENTNRRGGYADIISYIAGIDEEEYGFLHNTNLKTNIKPLIRCPYCKFSTNNEDEIRKHITGRAHRRAQPFKEIGYFWTYNHIRKQQRKIKSNKNRKRILQNSNSIQMQALRIHIHINTKYNDACKNEAQNY